MAGAIAVVLVACALAVSGTAAAQTISTEADLTVGVSTQDVQATAVQARAFGELPRHWRFYGDLTWAARRGEESDAFGAAYPYEPDVRLMELYAERTVVKGSALWGTRIGRYRTPFGIYGRSDHGYTGFVRAPMIRYSDYWALSNNYLENGASVMAGATWLSAEASLGVASDQDEYRRPGGANKVVRVQSAGSSWMVGASHIETKPSHAWVFATGDASFTGIDARWMRSGIQVRGEWLTGRPFNRAATQGGYLDVMVHRPRLERVTALARLEYLDYFAGRFSRFPRRYTVGAKVRASTQLIAQVNYVHQMRDRTGHDGHASLDVSLTFSARPGR